MKKSLSSRITITRRGKIRRRPMSINHFRTRRDGKGVRDTRYPRGLDYPRKKIIGY